MCSAQNRVLSGAVRWFNVHNCSHAGTRQFPIGIDVSPCPAGHAQNYRDIATFRAGGYEVAGIDALDVFPNSHHVEAVALLTRADARG